MFRREFEEQQGKPALPAAALTNGGMKDRQLPMPSHTSGPAAGALDVIQAASAAYGPHGDPEFIRG
jgi:hypothetical protein